jgi:hypothetical protein
MTRNWPPRCLEIVAPNSTVLDQQVLDHVIQVRTPPSLPPSLSPSLPPCD